MPRSARRGLCLVWMVLASVAGVSAAADAKAGVPRSFFGVVPQGPLYPGDYERMEGVVGTIRLPVQWFQLEPRPGEYDFASLDETVLRAAAVGIRILPFVYGSPEWVTSGSARPPLQSTADRIAWASFLRRIVRRYGPRGTLWDGRERRVPIHRWQVWNEPNYVLFWRPWPSPSAYAQLLRISARAIRQADRGATIVAAGVAPVEAGIAPWTFLKRMYKVPGVRRSFDVAALHPYAPYIDWVRDQIRLFRRVMAAAGDSRKPLQLTELGTASASSLPTLYDKGMDGQASFLWRLFRVLVEERHRWDLAGIDWFTWKDAPTADPHCVFCQHAGLLDGEGTPKLAWWAFQHFVTRVAAGTVR